MPSSRFVGYELLTNDTAARPPSCACLRVKCGERARQRRRFGNDPDQLVTGGLPGPDRDRRPGKAEAAGKQANDGFVRGAALRRCGDGDGKPSARPARPLRRRLDRTKQLPFRSGPHLHRERDTARLPPPAPWRVRIGSVVPLEHHRALGHPRMFDPRTCRNIVASAWRRQTPAIFLRDLRPGARSAESTVIPPWNAPMNAVPRYRPFQGPTLFSAGFRPFFLLAGLAAAFAIPLWLLDFAGIARLPSAFPPLVWHVHEMVFGFGLAAFAGFLFTSVPNWTGRMPLQGPALAGLAGLWLLGRIAVFFSAPLGEAFAAPLDLVFPLALLAVIGREILAGRNWRNLPVLAALSLLFAADAWVHLAVLGLLPDPERGNRLGVATLLLLVSMMGGRLVPSFTRNWLARRNPEAGMPASFGPLDRAALGGAALALLSWVLAPTGSPTGWFALAAGALLLVRLARWQGWRTWPEPLLLVLHLGYAWLAGGLLLLGFSVLTGWLAPADAIHGLTIGAIGTMTLAVMTRATLGHTGRALHAGPGTTLVYALVSLAALLRLAAPLAGGRMLLLLALAAAAWSAAFGLFVALYLAPLARPRTHRPEAP